MAHPPKAYALLVGLALLALSSQSLAQQAAKPGESLEKLTEDANDPTAILAQLKIEDDYTPDQYGTQAAPNDIIIQPVIPIRPFSLMPLTQLVRPTFKVVTIAEGSGPATNTQFGETQFFDLLVSRWPDPGKTGLRWGIGPYFVFPTATTSAAGSGTWQAGPAGAVVYRGIPGLLLGGLLQQGTSFSYTAPDRKPVTQLTFQPFFVYQLGKAGICDPGTPPGPSTCHTTPRPRSRSVPGLARSGSSARAAASTPHWWASGWPIGSSIPVPSNSL
jgi:hypothetical protein